MTPRAALVHTAAMDIGILGSGHIGSTLARHLVRLGHRVRVANSRGPDSLRALVSSLGESATAATLAEAITASELVIEAIPFGKVTELPADLLRGKIVVSAANYYPGRDGAIDLGGLTQSEYVARHLAGARVIKAFNTIWFQHLQDQARPGAPLATRRIVPLAGDDAEAKRVVADLIDAIGFAPVDMGTLADSHRMHPGAPIYNNDLTLEQAAPLLGA